MNINDTETYEALSIELLLNEKVTSFFQHPEVRVRIFQASTAQDSASWQQICQIEKLIAHIRDSIAIGQLKRALKYLIALDYLMKRF